MPSFSTILSAAVGFLTRFSWRILRLLLLLAESCRRACGNLLGERMSPGFRALIYLTSSDRALTNFSSTREPLIESIFCTADPSTMLGELLRCLAAVRPLATLEAGDPSDDLVGDMSPISISISISSTLGLFSVPAP